MRELIHKQECFQLVGLCMEIHRELGKGHAEAFCINALNYLAASKLRPGLLVNFGSDSLEWQRVVL